MKARILQIVLGIAMFFCSSPFGFAAEASAGEARAAFFAGADAGGRDGGAAVAAFSDAALQFAGCEADGESSVDGEEEVRRVEKRTVSHKIIADKCRVSGSLSAARLSKGAAKHPESQDARQERTAAIRFLHLEALIH